MNLSKQLDDVRQILLDLLAQYQNLDKPVNPDLLKIFIEDSEDKIQALIDTAVVEARIDELNNLPWKEKAKNYYRPAMPNVTKTWLANRIAALTRGQDE